MFCSEIVPNQLIFGTTNITPTTKFIMEILIVTAVEFTGRRIYPE